MGKTLLSEPLPGPGTLDQAAPKQPFVPSLCPQPSHALCQHSPCPLQCLCFEGDLPGEHFHVPVLPSFQFFPELMVCFGFKEQSASLGSLTVMQGCCYGPPGRTWEWSPSVSVLMEIPQGCVICSGLLPAPLGRVFPCRVSQSHLCFAMFPR